jgi:hypothetical protein
MYVQIYLSSHSCTEEWHVMTPVLERESYCISEMFNIELYIFEEQISFVQLLIITETLENTRKSKSWSTVHAVVFEVLITVAIKRSSYGI